MYFIQHLLLIDFVLFSSNYFQFISKMWKKMYIEKSLTDDINHKKTKKKNKEIHENN